MPPKERCRRIECTPQTRSSRPCLTSLSMTRLKKRMPFILVPQSCTSDPPSRSSYSLPRSVISQQGSVSSLSLSCACSFNQLVNRTCRHLHVNSDHSNYGCELDIQVESGHAPIQDTSCKCSNAQALGPQVAKRLSRPPVKTLYNKFESLPSTPASTRTQRSINKPQVREASVTAAPRSTDAATSETPKNSQNKRSQCNINPTCRSVAIEICVPRPNASSKGTDIDEPYTKTIKPRNQKSDKVADTKSLKFGKVLPSCFKDVGVDACSESCPLKVRQEGCVCTFPPAYNSVGCTGNIMGSCRCGKS